jgi:hypothetical protein
MRTFNFYKIEDVPTEVRLTLLSLAGWAIKEYLVIKDHTKVVFEKQIQADECKAISRRSVNPKDDERFCEQYFILKQNGICRIVDKNVDDVLRLFDSNKVVDIEDDGNAPKLIITYEDGTKKLWPFSPMNVGYYEECKIIPRYCIDNHKLISEYYPQQMYIIKKEGLYGIIGVDEEEIIPCKYKDIHSNYGDDIVLLSEECKEKYWSGHIGEPLANSIEESAKLDVERAKKEAIERENKTASGI